MTFEDPEAPKGVEHHEELQTEDITIELKDTSPDVIGDSIAPHADSDSEESEPHGDMAADFKDVDNMHVEATEVFDDEHELLLKTDWKTGLDTTLAEERLLKFGRNEITEVKQSKLLKFLLYFWGPIAFLIEAAAILAAALKDWLDFGIIMGLLFVNAFIGYIEETRAESALDALRQTLAQRSRVFRDGKLTEIESALLVPGDIIVVRLGDIVPADGRLLGIGVTGEPAECDLHVDQSALTGESLPVAKHKGATIYSSSIVKQGQMLAVVTATGDKTFIGRAANLIAITNEPGHFQKVIEKIGNFLIIITIALVGIMVIVRLARGFKVIDTIEDALVITIAAIPVGLPTVLSVTMAVGAKQLAAKQVIVKRLTAVEEMAGIDILCSDKTGTLTLNHLTMDKPYLESGCTEDYLLLNALLSSEPGANDPIESAVRTAAVPVVFKEYLAGMEARGEIVEGKEPHIPSVPEGYRILSFRPFDPVAKYTCATVEDQSTSKSFKVAKGAPHVIIRMCGDSHEAHDAVNAFAARGLRALGVARAEVVPGRKDEWKMIGLLSFLDPPRHDSAETIKNCNKYGVSVKMVTGDQLVIAKEVAQRLGMARTILDSHKLVDPNVSEQDLCRRCEKGDGFAQVIPEHKFRVVELLQKRGHLVGMTGDGVNDAPALKKANVGIAVHGCTDAARSAADIVLLAPGLSTIIDGIKVSRAIFQRMRSYALYRITSTIHFLIFFFITILALDWALPPKLIVLITLLNDAATLVISVDNARINQRPDKWRLGQLISLSFVLAIMLVAASFAHYFIAKDVFNVSDDELDTIMYLQVSSCPHFVIFGTRLQQPFWTSRPSLVFFLAVAGTQVFAMFISVYGVIAYPIGWAWGASIMAISIGYFIIMDFVKVFLYKKWNYKLTVKLAPFPARKRELARREAEAIRFGAVMANWRKVRLASHVIYASTAFARKPLAVATGDVQVAILQSHH
eukprot:Opistho-2@51916